MNLIKVFFTLLLFSVLAGVLIGLVFQKDFGNIAVINIHGTITSTSDSLFSDSVNAEEVVNELREARDNPLIKAVIIDINSGGGSSVGSDAIVKAIKELDKPSVALIRDVGASGAYWVASACDYIIAHNLSIVGSLGVRMDYLELSGLLDKYNVSYVNLSYPEHKDMLSQFRPLTPVEREWVNEWLRTAYDYFINSVAENRNMSVSELTLYANGSAFLGSQAFNYGLIDGLGGWPEALNKTMELGNVSEPILLRFDEGFSLINLLSGVSGSNHALIKT